MFRVIDMYLRFLEFVDRIFFRCKWTWFCQRLQCVSWSYYQATIEEWALDDERSPYL